MTTETLNSLTQETVRIYARTAKTVVKAYRVGAHRALGGFTRSLGRTAGAVDVDRPVRSSVLNASRQLAQYVGGRVDALSSAADGAIDAVAKGSSKALGAYMVAVDRFYDRFPARAGEVFARINLPAVRLSRDVAAKISAGAEHVAKRAAGPAAARPARKPAKRVVRRAAVKGAKRAARKA